jgi:hypothetical protein
MCGTVFACMPQIGERYVIRLRVAANKEPLEYVERPARDMVHSLLSSRRPDLYMRHLSRQKGRTPRRAPSQE